MKIKQCLQCKGGMPKKREGAKFCNSKCRSDYNNQLHREDIKAGLKEAKRMYHPSKSCVTCNTVFKPVRSTNIYCSPKCREKQRNKLYAANKAAIINDINDLL